MRAVERFVLVSVLTLGAASPATAGIPLPATPGPLIGAGVPALIGLAYLYKRIRKSRA